MNENTSSETRSCPHCFESIHVEATRCPKCTSFLLASQVPETAPKEQDTKEDEVVRAPGHITYIVDKDLIRFGKLALASLSLILVVGGVFTGFDLKNAVTETDKDVKEVDATRQTIKEAEKQVAESKKNLEAELATVQRDYTEVKSELQEIRDVMPAVHQIAATSQAQLATSSGEPNFSGRSSSVTATFSVSEIERAYNFPVGLDGQGQTIAIIELGGGFRPQDLTKYFGALKLPVPLVNVVSIDGGKNSPSTASSADGQVYIDIEISGVIAPKARQTVYFTPNTDKGFIDAVRAAVNDKQYPPAIMLIGWGSPEKKWTSQSLHALDDALHEAAIHQITVVAAGGGEGSTDGTEERSVDFPSSSPWVLAVGGTSLNKQTGKEVVWNGKYTGATEGGISKVFPEPDWQTKAQIPPFFGQTGRAVPDVSANADATEAGYKIYVDGESQTIGGTTAAAPVWAALIALLNQGVGRRLGYLNPVIYQSVGPAKAFNDIVEGHNSVHGVEGCRAGPGWDYCSGWGSPNGVKLLSTLRDIKH